MLKTVDSQESKPGAQSLGQPVGTALPCQEVGSLAPPDELRNGETDMGVKSKG